MHSVGIVVTKVAFQCREGKENLAKGLANVCRREPGKHKTHSRDHPRSNQYNNCC
jgi:hypothetical protein